MSNARLPRTTRRLWRRSTPLAKRIPLRPSLGAELGPARLRRPRAALNRAGLQVLAGVILWAGVALACSRGNIHWPVVASPAQVVAGATASEATSTAFVDTGPVVVPDATSAAALATLAYVPSADWLYITQAGDTLAALAKRFGVSPEEIQPAQPLQGSPLLDPGQFLVIRNALDEMTPSLKLIPDSELVFAANASSFDVAAYVAGQGGHLSDYRGFVGQSMWTGAEIVERVSLEQSINPRLLLGLLEYTSRWVTDPDPELATLRFPMGNESERENGLYHQLSWAADTLNVGYYRWRDGSLTHLTFSDGSSLRLAPDLNAGTVGLYYLLAVGRDRAAWAAAVAADGFAQQVAHMFGDPFARALDPLLPAGLSQPSLELPFPAGRSWSYTGGPHGAWEQAGANAAIDFGPPSMEGGCLTSEEWVTASASGVVVRAEEGVLMLDLDGDGREQTGWVLFYLHVAEQDRVPAGTFVETGDRLGHPSCEGGWATGTHLHFARKFNGEWISAAGPLALVLSGWQVGAGDVPYHGTLERDGVTIVSCTCSSPSSWVSH